MTITGTHGPAGRVRAVRRDAVAREEVERVVLEEVEREDAEPARLAVEVRERALPPRVPEPLFAVEDALRREAPRCVVVLRAMPGVL